MSYRRRGGSYYGPRRYRPNLGYALGFPILSILAYIGLRVAVHFGYDQIVLIVSALSIGFSLVALYANAEEIFN